MYNSFFECKRLEKGALPFVIYTVDKSQGGVWINTNIDISELENLIFAYTSNGERSYIRQMSIEDIAIYTGGADVFTTVFPVGAVGLAFNVRIYNNLLYVSFERVGASTDFVSIYDGELNI